MKYRRIFGGKNHLILMALMTRVDALVTMNKESAVAFMFGSKEIKS